MKTLNYTIFSNNKTDKANFCFKIYNKLIKYEKNPVLLGVTFDKFLNFNDQVVKIREKCMDRLNLIKVLSHKSWKLTVKTLVTLYKSLIGSIIDYSSFLIHQISKSNLKKIQAIQNKAIRVIFKRSCFLHDSTEFLSSLSNMSTVYERSHTLNSRFISRAIPCNIWISQMVYDFLRSYNKFKGNSTPLHFYVNCKGNLL